MPEPFAVPPGKGRAIQGPAGGPLIFKARGDQTDGSLTVIENVIAPGDGPPMSGMERFFDAFAGLPGGREAFVTAGRAAGMDVTGPPLGGA